MPFHPDYKRNSILQVTNRSLCIAGLPAWELVSKLPLFPHVPFSHVPAFQRLGKRDFMSFVEAAVLAVSGL